MAGEELEHWGSRWVPTVTECCVSSGLLMLTISDEPKYFHSITFPVWPFSLLNLPYTLIPIDWSPSVIIHNFSTSIRTTIKPTLSRLRPYNILTLFCQILMSSIYFTSMTLSTVCETFYTRILLRTIKYKVETLIKCQSLTAEYLTITELPEPDNSKVSQYSLSSWSSSGCIIDTWWFWEWTWVWKRELKIKEN